MKILITGSHGYIGKAIINYFHINFPLVEIVEVDLKIGTNIKNITGQQFDTIIHLAAYISVEESNTKKADYISNNVVDTISLINNNEFDNFIFASTNAIFTPAGNIHPDSVYGATKLSIENYLMDQLPDNSTIIRIANPIGLYDYHKSIIDQIDSETATVFYKLALCKANKYNFLIHNLKGMVRDFIDLEIVSKLIVSLCMSNDTKQRGLFHMGSGISTEIIPLLVNLCRDYRIEYKFIEPPPGVDEGFIMDSNRAHKYLDYEPLKYNYSKILNSYISLLS
tara:strand:- start:642 stop:1484 length:843 start_codon:yes stop_codon:yes gene_type:complete